MKGTIVKCLEELVKTKHGDDRWQAILIKTGLPPFTFFSAAEIVPDEQVVQMLEATASVLAISLDEAMDAFGDHWSTTYAPGIYAAYFKKAKSAKELLLNLDHIHVAMTKTAGASPPRFTYEWRGDDHLVMHYRSPRGLVALMPGLIRGVGRYYREAITVTLIGNEVHVTFGRPE
ncbi:MAG TPA: heme NO-binding domain-containing protein [Polyangiales bacterium]|nr:heme NO-binding domain-containing protein [Polyangiales bacterium]